LSSYKQQKQEQLLSYGQQGTKARETSAQLSSKVAPQVYLID
jgi:hypothetical protein